MALPTVASVVASGLASYPSVYYDRKAVAFLRNNLHLYDAIETKPMPDKSGVAMQIFGYTKLGANTTAATDGTPQSAGVALTASTGTISLSQYVDYVTYSDKVVLTGISPVIEEGSELLAYRGALTVDTLISAAVDTATSIDTTVVIDLAHQAYVTAAIARKAVFQLRANDVKPKDNGLYFGVMSALLAFDLVNDANAGGYQDMFRFADPKLLQKGVDPASQRIAVIGGAEWYESNSLPITSAFQSTGVNGYRAYLFGKDAFFCASLGKTQLGQKNFSVATKMYDGTNSLDPGGVIRAASVYNFFFGVSPRPQGVGAYRRIRSESTIG